MSKPAPAGSVTSKSRRLTTKELVHEAADAHTRLSTFYAVIAVLEGNLPGGCARADRTALSIIHQCKAAAQIQLDKFDAATDEVCARTALSQIADTGDAI